MVKVHQPSAGVEASGLGVSRVYPWCAQCVSEVYPGVFMGCIWSVSGVYLVILVCIGCIWLLTTSIIVLVLVVQECVVLSK